MNIAKIHKQSNYVFLRTDAHCLLQISAKERARETRIHYTRMIEIRWFDLVSSPDDLMLFKKRDDKSLLKTIVVDGNLKRKS